MISMIHRLLAVILVLAILHNRWIWLKLFWNCKQIIEEKWSLCRLHFKLYSFSNKTRNEDQLFIRFSPIQEKSEENLVSLLIKDSFKIIGARLKPSFQAKVWNLHCSLQMEMIVHAGRSLQRFYKSLMIYAILSECLFLFYFLNK